MYIGTNHGSYATLTAAGIPLSAERVYYPGIPSTGLTEIHAGIMPIVSVVPPQLNGAPDVNGFNAGKYDAEYTAFLETLPDVCKFTVFAEAELAQHNLKPLQVRAMHQHAVEVFNSIVPSDMQEYYQCFSAYAFTPEAALHIEEYISPHVQGYALDLYSSWDHYTYAVTALPSDCALDIWECNYTPTPGQPRMNFMGMAAQLIGERNANSAFCAFYGDREPWIGNTAEISGLKELCELMQ